MKKYVQVAINLPDIEGVFDYHIPDELRESIEVGSLILVPFGRQKVQGVITAFVDSPQVSETKAVLDVLHEKPVITRHHLELLHWMAKETLSSEFHCLQLLLPGGLGKVAESLYTLREVPADLPLSPLQRKIIAQLKERGPLRGRQIDTQFPRQRWKESIKKLIARRVVTAEPYLDKPKVKPKYVSVARLLVGADSIHERYAPRRKITPAVQRRRAVLEYLAEHPGDVLAQVLYGKTGANRTDLERLAKAGLIEVIEIESIRDPLESIPEITHPKPKLTAEQQNAWEKIREKIHGGNYEKPVVLHGVTGSGKTEIYLLAVEEVLRRGRQAIVLVPEISLTPQTVQRFLVRFPKKVGVFHSRLSEGERYDTWRRVLSGELSVVVGPRSALFVPFENPGIIILDESHDDSYYQDDKPPRYSSLVAAKALGRIANALVIYGSATPGVEMMYRANLERWDVLQLPFRVLAHRNEVLGFDVPKEKQKGDLVYLPLPKVHLVDMRAELKAGNKSIFSRVLHAQIQKTLDSGNQAILFLNRRGTATYIFCRACGYRVNCPRCDLALTYHADQDICICHHCNYRRQLPKKCPECGSDQIRQFGAGTERVEQEAIRQFPKARVLRLDSSIARQKGAHLTIMNQFASRQADILVGTQMLAKGIDFPHVTLVGVVLADVGLGLPDFRSPEKTFQLLTQVAGRAGRSPLGGNVVFQTYQPEHYAIQKASRHDFEAYYRQEIESRKNMDYPPFSRLIRLEFRSPKEEDARQQCEMAAEVLRQMIADRKQVQTELIGPVPCFFQRIGGEFRWQLIIRGPRPAELLRGFSAENANVTVDPISLL